MPTQGAKSSDLIVAMSIPIVSRLEPQSTHAWDKTSPSSRSWTESPSATMATVYHSMSLLRIDPSEALHRHP